jgi:hypothetical protein
MVENGRWKKFGVMEILILTMMSTGIGLISIAAFLYLGMLSIAVVGSGLIILSIALWALAASSI